MVWRKISETAVKFNLSCYTCSRCLLLAGDHVLLLFMAKKNTEYTSAVKVAGMNQYQSSLCVGDFLIGHFRFSETSCSSVTFLGLFEEGIL